MDGEIPEEEKLSSSSDSEEEVMTYAQPLTMGDYCKRIDEGKVPRGFVLVNCANFDIKNSVLLGLRENLFDENKIRDPWAHLACLYETTSMCKPIDVTENNCD